VSNRHERRRLQRQVSKLETQRNDAHAQLIDVERQLSVGQEEKMAAVERYVNARADEQRIHPGHGAKWDDDERLYTAIAKSVRPSKSTAARPSRRTSSAACVSTRRPAGRPAARRPCR
jgi:hypothetical protein